MAMESESFLFEPAFGKPHPLLIPSVICEIVGYLDFEDLKTCRLISQEWDQAAYKAMRGRALISITNYKRLKDFLFSFEDRKDFCDTFILGCGLNISTPLMAAFFDLFGASIQTLTLEKTKWCEDHLTSVLFDKLVNMSKLSLLNSFVPKGNARGRYFQSQLPRQLLKLKHLIIDFPSWETDHTPGLLMKTLVLDFFSISPNLETITCPKTDEDCQALELLPLDPVHVNSLINGDVLDVFDELNSMGFEKNIRQVLFDILVGSGPTTPKLPNLTELNISMILREAQVRQLHLKSYPLQRLDIVITQNVTLSTLHNFLSSLSKTLNTLSVRFLRRSVCTLEFPSASALKNLHTLKITGFRGSMHFVSHLEQLETLIIVKVRKLSRSFPAFGADYPNPLQKMRVLALYEVEQRTQRSQRSLLIEQWASNFPNLKTLKLDNICDITLRSIFSELTELEELVARNGEFTDSALTGFSKAECDLLSNDLTMSAPVPEVAPFTSISSLQYLTKLELGSKNMTDIGIIFGVIPCRNVTNLSLTTYWMTDRALQKIVEVMDLEALKTQFCNQLTSNAVDMLYENDKMKGCALSINEYKGPMNQRDLWKFLKRYNDVKVSIPRLSQSDLIRYRSN